MSTGMTGVDLKSTLAQMGLTQGQLALAWGYSEEHVSRWANGKKPVPAWVLYALGLKTMGAVSTPKPVIVLAEPVEPAKPIQLPDFTKAADELIEMTHTVAKIVSKKPKDDDRPFRYMGGRKVYL